MTRVISSKKKKRQPIASCTVVSCISRTPLICEFDTIHMGVVVAETCRNEQGLTLARSEYPSNIGSIGACRSWLATLAECHLVPWMNCCQEPDDVVVLPADAENVRVRVSRWLREWYSMSDFRASGSFTELIRVVVPQTLDLPLNILSNGTVVNALSR